MSSTDNSATCNRNYKDARAFNMDNVLNECVAEKFCREICFLEGTLFV